MLMYEVEGFTGPLTADQQKAKLLKQKQDRLTAEKKAFQLSKARKRTQELQANQRALQAAVKSA